MNKPKTKAIDNKNKTTAYLAFFPLTGILGIHDILLGKNWKFFLRIILLGLSCWMLVLLGTTANTLNLIVLLYVWALIEGFMVLREKNVGEISQNNSRLKLQNTKELEKKKENSSIIAFSFSVVILPFNLFTVLSLRNIDLFGLFEVLILPIDIIVIATITFFGIKGLNTKRRGLAVTSLVMGVISIILLISLLIRHFVFKDFTY